MKILITAGGTQEPIDSVRYISNMSTGKTGAKLADTFIRQGADVTLLKAEGAAACDNKNCETYNFKTFDDLDKQLQKVLKQSQYDVVIHAAAVSDYSVSHIMQGEKEIIQSESGKIDSGDSLTIHLKKNFKMIDRLREYSRTPIFLVGFKLTSSEDQTLQHKAIAQMSQRNSTDLIVHNDLLTIQKTGRHDFFIYQAGLQIAKCISVNELAQIIQARRNNDLSF